jgi:phage shock protein A
MRSQLTSAFKLCSTAENALVLGQVQLGHNAVEKARHTAHWMRAHLEEPNHVPADAVASIGEQLAELEKRISNLEAQLQS